MWHYTHTDELYHHGVKGQRWGVRRTPAQLGHKTPSKWKKRREAKKREKAKAEAKRQAEEKEARRAKELSRKSHKKMTEAELNERIKRLELEKSYKKLMAEVNGRSSGKDFVMRVLERSGENLATQVVNHFGQMALNAAIQKATGEKEKVIFSNNKKKN